MSSYRNSAQRRRSQSATSGARRSIDDSFRAATKRAFQSSPFASDALSSQKWDPDFWRRGKRRRRDLCPPQDDDMDVDEDSDSPPSTSSIHLNMRRSVLPSSSAAFQIFPKGDRKNRRFTCHGDSLAIASSKSPVDVKQIRSSAFWELHRSVEQNGEGFVRRMRDLEKSRLTDRSYLAREAQKRGRKRASISSPPPPAPIFSSDDEDEIQIFGGDLMGGAPLLKRARSLDNANEDVPHLSLVNRPSPPGMAGDSNSSACPSEDEQDIQFDAAPISLCSPTGLLLTPTLTHANTDSANSSTVSLSLPPALSSASSPHDAHPSSPIPSSRTEKAIAALTLAMANGAAGINDYEALQASQAPFIMDECQASRSRGIHNSLLHKNGEIQEEAEIQGAWSCAK
ncbi:hypothetical protein HGRIS_007753 [Hohenbuehelia grisea]|uniref:Uncharacterized protein n=1 Tax=Hohenbuehelia grisea TaxID=104357 RepID=A0ABR3J5Z1_9AGAR